MTGIIIVRLARKREYCLVVCKVGAWALEMGLGAILLISHYPATEVLIFGTGLQLSSPFSPSLGLDSFRSEGQPCAELVVKYFD